MKRLPISIILLALLCLPQNSCRSTIYKAAERGDIKTVQQELDNGTNANASWANWGPLNIRVLPMLFGAIGIDMLQVSLTLGSLGALPYLLDWKYERTWTEEVCKKPLDVALDHGHYEIASLLREHHGFTQFNTHYHGDFSQKPTEQPRIKKQPQAKQAPRQQHTYTESYRYDPESSKNIPTPTVGGASGSISAH